MLTDRLSAVPGGTAQLLRTATLFGGRFAVTDLAVVLRRPASELAAGVQEAVTAGILTEQPNDSDLAFRHLLIQQALYESMPARELAAAGADVLSVAQQLSAANKPGEAWARTWLVESGPALAIRAPQVEVKIAVMVARGESTSDIARSMSLSRRTVQTYISHILAKLGVKGRVDIVREALRQGVSP